MLHTPSARAMIDMVRRRLHRAPPVCFDFSVNGNLGEISAVLFLLAIDSDGVPQLILNKRSDRVRQPGDLCCPGGGIAPRLDAWMAHGIDLPAMPLFRWPYRQWWRRHRPLEFSKMALLIATALREGFEEMRLNPLNVSFLGPMPPEHLVMFRRSIYPLVATINRHQRFSPNWEVAAIVRIPLSALLFVGNYACCRLSLSSAATGASETVYRDMPCFVHRHNGSRELLWGATYRIVERFLKTIFGFEPPALTALPVIQQHLEPDYIKGTTAG